MNESYEDSTLVLVAHGSRQNADSCAPALQHATALRRRGLFAEVSVAFCQQAPFIREVLPRLSSRRVFVVPLFIGEGLHATEDIPALLGEAVEVVRARRQRGEWPWRNPTEKQGKWVWYTPSIGSEPHLPDVILERVRESTRGLI